MAGTASEFYEYNEDVNHDIYSVDTFSTWLFGNINASCNLVEISHYGCSILIPQVESVIPARFSLLIMSQQDEQKLQSVFTGQQRWIDEDFSPTHKKMGILFSDIDDEQRSDIDDIAKLICRAGHNTIKCGLVKK